MLAALVREKETAEASVGHPEVKPQPFAISGEVMALQSPLSKLHEATLQEESHAPSPGQLLGQPMTQSGVVTAGAAAVEAAGAAAGAVTVKAAGAAAGAVTVKAAGAAAGAVAVEAAGAATGAAVVEAAGVAAGAAIGCGDIGGGGGGIGDSAGAQV